LKIAVSYSLIKVYFEIFWDSEVLWGVRVEVQDVIPKEVYFVVIVIDVDVVLRIENDVDVIVVSSIESFYLEEILHLSCGCSALLHEAIDVL
jgi:hypothetical protein